MKKAKLIERIAIIVFCCLLALTAGIIPLASYTSHKAYVDKINANKPQPVLKAKLVSIEARLVDGKEYYANNKAQVRAEDILVTAKFEKNGETYTEDVPNDKFTFEVNDRFAFDGGNITVTYRTKKATIPVTLQPVKLASLAMATKPYRVYYQTGSKFDIEGLTVTAGYNDGSSVIIGKDLLTYDENKTLAKSDKSVTVSYTEKDITKTLDVPVTVSDEVIDGKVTKLILTGNAYVNEGELLSTAKTSLLGEYESGNTLYLGESDYTIEARSETARIGRKYIVTAVYKEDTEVQIDVPVIVRKHIEGEDGTFIGSGKPKTETEYFVVDGGFVAGGSITFAGGFGEAVRNNKESSVSYAFTAEGSGVADLTLRCANGNRRHDEGGYYMTALQVNSVFDIYVNGKLYDMSDDVILAGVDVKDHNFVPCYNVYNTFVCKNIPVQAGDNVIKFSFKTSTKGETTDDGVSPSEFNIDYFDIDCAGTDLPPVSEIESLEIGDFERTTGIKVADIAPTVYANYKNGLRVVLAKEDYTVEISGEGVENGKLKAGKFTVKVTLKADSSKKAEQQFDVEVRKETITLPASQATLYERHDGYTTNNLGLKNAQSGYYDEEKGIFASEGEKQMICGFDWSSTPDHVVEDSVPSVTWNFKATGGTYTLSMKINNSYVTEVKDNGYTTNAFDLKDVLKITVNGKEVTYKAVKTPVFTSNRSEELFTCMYEIEIADVTLSAGSNELRLEGRTTSGLQNMYKETPAPRIEWAKMTSILLDMPEVVALDVKNLEYEIGTDISTIKPDVYAVYGNGDRVLLKDDEYTLAFDGDAIENGFLKAGKFKLTVEYVEDPSILFEQEYTVTANVETVLLDTSTVTLEEAHGGNSGNMLRIGGSESLAYDSRTGEFTSEGGRNMILGLDWSSSPQNYTTTIPSATWNFTANGGKYILSMRVNNSYVTKIGDTNAHTTNAYDLKDAIKVFVNGAEVTYKVITMPVIADNSGYERLFNTMFVVEIAEVTLNAGQNVLRVEGRTDCAYRNVWGEVPAPRIEWAKFTYNGEAAPVDPEPVEKKLVSIEMSELDYAYGQKISEIAPEVYGVYDDGSRKLLSSDDYTVTVVGTAADGETLVAGKFTLTVTLKEDTSKVISKEYEVEAPAADEITLNAADAVIDEYNTAGGTNMLRHGSNETVEYDEASNTFVSKGGKDLILGFDWSTTPEHIVDGHKPSVSWTFSAKAGSYSLSMRISNSYVTEVSGGNVTHSFQLKDVLKITLNGTEVMYKVAPTPVMTSGGYEELFNCMFNLDIAAVTLADGENVLKLEGRSECEYRNRWGEIPAPRIEWAKLTKSAAPETVTSLGLTETECYYGMNVSAIAPEVYAVYDNGDKIWLDGSAYTLSVSGSAVSGEKLIAGKVTVKASLVADTAISVEKEYEIAAPAEQEIITLNPADATLFENHNGHSTNMLQVSEQNTYGYDKATGTFTELGKKTVISGFDWSTTAKNVVDGQNPTITWNAKAAGGKYTFSLKINNLYVTQDQNTKIYSSHAFDLKEIIKVTVNGAEVNYKVVEMPAIDCNAWEPLFGYMFEVELAEVDLNAGDNEIKIEGRSECTYRDIWDEAPAPRIEWAKLTKNA